MKCTGRTTSTSTLSLQKLLYKVFEITITMNNNNISVLIKIEVDSLISITIRLLLPYSVQIQSNSITYNRCKDIHDVHKIVNHEMKCSSA